jgi:hypothetical protein
MLFDINPVNLALFLGNFGACLPFRRVFSVCLQHKMRRCWVDNPLASHVMLQTNKKARRKSKQANCN